MNYRHVINQIKLHYATHETNRVQIYSEEFVFDKNCYNSRLSQYLSKKEFNIIVSELNKIVTKSFIKKNKAERIKVYNFIYFLLAIIALFFILGSFCLFQAHKTYKEVTDDINLAYVIGIVLFTLMLIFILGLSWHNFNHITYQMITLENTIHNYIKQYIGFLNLYFQGVLKWVYHQTIVMIEITILNTEDDDNFISAGFNKELLKRRKTDYIDDIFEVLEEENDDIDREIESQLYGIKRKKIEDEDPTHKKDEQTNKLDSESLIHQNTFKLTRENLKKIIEKNKKKRVEIFHLQNEQFKTNIRKSYSK